MAVMIPSTPHKYTPSSMEGLMFEALKTLPDTYFVFHSFKINRIIKEEYRQSEVDFVIFNSRLGILCLEAKAGQVKYDGCWKYANDEKMKNGGPFRQAEDNKYDLLQCLKDSKYSALAGKCKFMHAVWFPSRTTVEINQLPLPLEADKAVILTRDEFERPEELLEKKIKQIFALKLEKSNVETTLSDYEAELILKNILCPKFDVFPTAAGKAKIKDMVFHRLISEQMNILNFISEQNTAVIHGAAGTGKTVIAVEKAKRHAVEGEKVLFLCFNSQLADFLSENYEYDNVDYMTISSLATKWTGKNDFDSLKKKLEEHYFNGTFPYKHIIIDEAQDFGKENLDEANIIKWFRDIIVDTKENGTFYLFCDKLQLMYSSNIPEYIDKADCKLTLYKNCRNTENIAKTSVSQFKERKIKLKENSLIGVPTQLYFSEDNVCEIIDSVIAENLKDGLKDIVILTMTTEENSVLYKYAEKVSKDVLCYKGYKFTTCRKFKGLEAEAVILVDVNKDTFNDKNKMIFYVGASRARIKLDIIADMSDEDCDYVVKNNFKSEEKYRNPKKKFVECLNCITGVV